MSKVSISGPVPAFSELRSYHPSWTWQELQWGRQHNIVQESDIRSFAMESLTEDHPLYELLQDIVTEKPGSEQIDRKVDALCRAESTEPENRLVFVWSYVLLSWLYDTETDEDQLRNRVELLYADFGYPYYMSTLIGWMPPVPGEKISRPWSTRKQLEYYLEKHANEINS